MLRVYNLERPKPCKNGVPKNYLLCKIITETKYKNNQANSLPRASSVHISLANLRTIMTRCHNRDLNYAIKGYPDGRMLLGPGPKKQTGKTL